MIYRLLKNISFTALLLIASPAWSNEDPLLDKSRLALFEKLIAKPEIDQRLAEVGAQIDRDLNGEEVILVMVMKGAICIAADLMRHMNSPCILEFIQTSSYGARGSNRGELVINGLEKLNLEEKNVLVIDDIFDSGVTLTKVVEKLSELKPKRLLSVVFLEKRIPHKVDYRPDYTLFEVDNHFIVGYGMDYKEHWRELPEVYAVH